MTQAQKKGKRMTKHSASPKNPSHTGFFATLAAFFPSRGTTTPKITIVTTFVVLTAFLAFTGTALAAAPTVSSESTSPTVKPSEELRLEATVNAGEEAAGVTTECHFQYGKTSVIEPTVACEQGTPPGTLEGGEQGVTATVKGLKPGTTYHYRVVLKNTSGKIEGNPEAVTTLPVPSTEAASAIGATTATFHGKLTPFNSTEPPEYFFSYNVGEELACTNEHETGHETASAEAVTTKVTELQPNQKYTVCLLATNTLGNYEEDVTPKYFETLPAPPKIDSESASSNSTEATLFAQVNPNNEPTKYTFEYSTTEANKKLTGTIVTINGASELTGGTDQTAEVLTGAVLEAGKTYYYRVVAANAQSEIEPHPAEGEVQSFTTVPTPATDPVTAIGTTTATFNGHLTLSALATSYSFDYKLGGSECTGESSTSSTAATSASVSTPVSGLQPGRLYTVCLVTANAFGSQAGPAVTFKTLPETYVTDASSSSATLHAVLDPEGSTTTYSFQYGTNTTYGPETPPASAGSGSKPIAVEAHIQGLSAGTVYHFRVVGSVGAQAFQGADMTFTTQPEGSEFSLPDGREYEMVSPPDKYGGTIEPITHEGGVIQASENGDAITYVSVNPVVSEPPGNRALEDAQVLSRRGPEGWSTEEITTPHNDVGLFTLGKPAEYQFFSPDLALGLVEPKGETSLPPLSEGAERTIYLRNDNDCAPTRSERIPSTCYLALVTAANVEVPGSKIAQHEGEGLSEHPIFQGASPDLSHVVFKDFEPLTKGAGSNGLYEWAGGHLSLVSVLPGSAGPTGGSAVQLGAGAENEVVRHAVSNNGSRLIWRDEGALYLRDMARGETVQVDAPEPGGEGGGEAVFQTASSDGSKIFFTDYARLTANATVSLGADAADLYVFEVTSGEGEALAGRLTDLSVDPSFAKDGERAAVQGEIIGASEDGSYVYFVANGLIGDAEERGATPGDCKGQEPGRACNLYVEHFDGSGWEAPEWVATLSGEDFPDWSEDRKHLPGLTARVSPDGRWLAFMSDESLTGYDNVDVNSDVPDEEVFLFDAGSGSHPSTLVCASCDPTGARPVGVFDPRGGEGEGVRLLVDERVVWEGRWLAGSVPGWTSDEIYRALYQSRYLSDSGRLFFDAAGGLVPADTNGKEDVYEFEPAGVPAGERACSSASASSSEVFKPARAFEVELAAGKKEEGEEGAGCVALISSGTSSRESAFLDANATGGRDSEGNEGGGDVFFLTASQLVPQDDDEAYDIYDAHECTVSSRCVSQTAAAVPPACNNEASCKPAPETQPSIYGLPASATFAGESNFAPAGGRAINPVKKVATKKTVKCKKGQTKNKKGKCIRKKSKKKAKKSAKGRK